MAITTTIQKLYDGPRKATIQATGLTIDGPLSNNLTLATLVDLALLAPVPAQVRVDHIEGEVGYGVVQLFWAALTPIRFAVLSGSRILLDYANIGGLIMPVGGTGNILVSTLGFDLNSTFTVKLDLTKRVVVSSKRVA